MEEGTYSSKFSMLLSSRNSRMGEGVLLTLKWAVSRNRRK
jgi:hypothetical protein